MTQSTHYPNLLSPIRLGPIELKNRSMMSGHSMRHGEADGTIGERQHQYILARAEGGAALVSLESLPVHESSVNFPNQIRLFTDSVIPGLTYLSDAVHEAGSLLSAILWHGGANVSHYGRGPALAPSPLPAPGSGEIPKEITLREIRDVVEGYRSAASQCKQAGLDAVEVQTASNYLLGSFLSPVLNRRTDAYGGSFEARLRIVIEVLESVKDAVGGTLAVGVRTSLDHGIGQGDEYGPALAIRILQALVDRQLVDWVSVMSGSAYSRANTIPPMHVPPAFLSEESAAVREALQGTPVVVAGRIRKPADAEQILENGQADVIAMARSWIAEPDWISKAASGREEQIRPCMSCNQGCLGFNLRNKPGTCVVNPVAGREFEYAAIRKSKVAKHIAVIGGGPAGMEMARVSALRGHRVTLFEQRELLGGAMRVAATAPHRGEIMRPIRWWERELSRLGVAVELGSRIETSPEGMDHVAWAIGAKPSQLMVTRRRPDWRNGIPGSDRLTHGRDALEQKMRYRGKMLIVDEEGAWPAISIAEWLASQPAVTEVTVVATAAEWGAPALELTAELSDVRSRVGKAGIEVLTGRTIDQIRSDNVVDVSDSSSLGPYDDILLCTGATARSVPIDDHAIGDCVAPRGMWAAVHDAALLARRL